MCFEREQYEQRPSAAELRELRACGFTGLSIGTETDDDLTLFRMNKSTTATEILVQSRRLDDAGIEYYFIYMMGLSGAAIRRPPCRACRRRR